MIARKLVFIAVVLAMAAPLGCGPQGGAMLYYMGKGRNKKIEPVYQLPKGKLLILVDDTRGLVSTPQARPMLARAVGEILLKRDAVTEVISTGALDRMRRLDPRFDRRTAHEIGRRLGADTVLWLEVQEFFVPEEIQDTSVAAQMTVSVKVLDTSTAGGVEGVRLWPSGSAGHIEQATLGSNDVNKLGGEEPVVRGLVDTLAKQVSRLFFEYTLGELEDEEV